MWGSNLDSFLFFKKKLPVIYMNFYGLNYRETFYGYLIRRKVKGYNLNFIITNQASGFLMV